MTKIPLEDLRPMWEAEGIHGPWRHLLKRGYDPDDLYFEFGLMPEKDHKCFYRVILDHDVPVWLCPRDASFRGEYVIQPSNEKAGAVSISEHTGLEGFRYHTFYVGEEHHAALLEDAFHVYQEYKDKGFICFWSIPNRWFNDLELVKFLADKVVSSDDYRQRRRRRNSWYWP